MKILNMANVAGTKRGGGVHEVVYNFWSIQNHIGIDSVLWFPGFEEEESDLIRDSNNLKVRALKTYFHPSNGLLKNFGKLLSQGNEFDIIHQHGIWVPISKFTIEAYKRYKSIIVIQPHGYLEPYSINMSKRKKILAYFLYEKQNFEYARLLLACSFKEYLNLRELFPSKDIAIIPNGVSEEFYNSKSNGDYFNNYKYLGRKNLLFLSRIHPLKGLVRLLKAYAMLDKSLRENWNIIIAGIDQNNHTNELMQIAKELKILDHVYFEGEKFKDEKVNIMSSADFFVLPTYTENYGIVIAESLSRGVPVLTTKGAPWSLLEKESCGFWVDNNTQGLKTGLEKVFQLTKEDLVIMGENGRRIAKEKFLWESIVHKTFVLYTWLMYGGEKPDFVYLGDHNTKNNNIFRRK